MPTPFPSSTSLTCSDWVEQTRRHLHTGQQEVRNKLATDRTAVSGEETWTFDREPVGIQVGSVLSVGLENVYVWAVTTTDATVQRGWEGTTPAAHAAGSVVTVNPRFSDFHIVQALNDDLRALSAAGLFAVRTLTFVFDGSAYTYDLADDLIDVLEVRYDEDSSANRWPLIDDYQVMRDMPTTEFASGVALRIDGRAASQRDVLVRYKASYGQLTALTDNVEATTGLHPEAHDIPPLGAAIRLAGPRDIRRTDTVGQGDTRRSGEVPPGTPQTAVRDLAARRQQRLAEEQGRMYARYPLRRNR